MGNCQAAEAATVVIQHPGNKSGEDLLNDGNKFWFRTIFHYWFIFLVFVQRETQENREASNLESKSCSCRSDCGAEEDKVQWDYVSSLRCFCGLYREQLL